MATEYSGIAAEGRLPAVEQTLTTRPQPRSAIGGSGRPHRPQRRHHVELVLASRQSCVGDVVEVAPAGDAGVVDEHVEGAELLARARQHPLAGVGVGDVEASVGGAGPALAAGLVRRRGGRAQLVLAAGDQQHVGALGAELDARSRGRSRGWRR